MNNVINLIPKGKEREYQFAIFHDGKSYYLRSLENDANMRPLFSFELRQENSCFAIIEKDAFVETSDVIKEKLLALSMEWIERENKGLDDASEEGVDTQQIVGYSADDIIVENKPFSLKQIYDLILSGDLEVAPDFQRNFIWDRTRQSRLIESLLLGLPTPSIYLSQYDDGLLTIVDGLQRITTIRRFFDNELVLCNLEYLTICNGCTYNTIQDVLSPLRLRRFGQTQIMCFVIDYRSPQNLKYDLFRRLNTGGQPLNNQEIRNCLSRKPLQALLKEMIECDEFLRSTDYSIRNTRMEAQELALKFIYFYKKYDDITYVGDYTGNMDSALNDEVETLNKILAQRPEKADEFKKIFADTLQMAYEIFGRYTFRKIFPDYENNRRGQINKSLFIGLCITIATHYETIDKLRNHGKLIRDMLADLIENDNQLFNSITWSTNSKTNICYVFEKLKELFEEATTKVENEKYS